MLRLEFARRWHEFRRNALVGILGIVILVALLQGAGAVFQGLRGPAAMAFLGAFFALAGAAEQIGGMRKGRTIIHLMRGPTPRLLIARTLAVDVVFSLPMLIIAVIAQTGTSGGVGGLPSNAFAALLSYLICLPLAWFWCSHAFSASNLASLSAGGLLIAALSASLIVRAWDLGSVSISSARDVAAAAVPGFGWVWLAYLLVVALLVAVSELLLLWWRQGGDIFA